jgi:hypothetical protein
MSCSRIDRQNLGFRWRGLLNSWRSINHGGVVNNGLIIPLGKATTLYGLIITIINSAYYRHWVSLFSLFYLFAFFFLCFLLWWKG